MLITFLLIFTICFLKGVSLKAKMNKLYDVDDFVVAFSLQYYILENHALCFMHVCKYLLMGLSEFSGS